MKVLWLTFIPSPYRLSFFEELGKQCELTVLFERASSKIRKNNWDDYQFRGFEGKILLGLTIGGYDRLCPGVVKYLNRKYDRIVISNPTSPTGILAAGVLRAKGIPYMIESDGAFPTGRKGGIRQSIKRFVMKPAAICFSTAELHDRYYGECGVSMDCIRRYPFTSLGEADIEDGCRLSQVEKSSLKNQLGMGEEVVILAVGQFVPRKGFDILLEAMRYLPKYVGLYMIGDVPPEEYCRFVQDHHLDHVHFIGFQSKKGIAKYYAAADLFVLPTREDIWGLVINEAMAYGLPVITTDRCIAGLELVRNGENGYIVPVGDAKQLAARIQDVLKNPNLRETMGQRSLEIIKTYTFENMCKVHMDVFSNGE